MLAGFIGFLLGAAVVSGGAPAPMMQQMLATIPLRCLMLFEDDVEAYKACRLPSLIGELGRSGIYEPNRYSACYFDTEEFERRKWAIVEKPKHIGKTPLQCDPIVHLQWEVDALFKLKVFYELQKEPKQ